MEKLPDSWLTDGLIDFEYKKYLLLAYLQRIDKDFAVQKLYPHLGELVGHYKNLQNFVKRKKQTEDAFPKQLDSIDLDKFILSYRQVVEDDEVMAEIEKIVDWSIPTLQKSLDEGTQIYDFIEKQLKLIPVGIIPLETRYGYLLVRNGDKVARVFSYQMSLIENASSSWRGLAMHFVSTYTTSIVNTYEAIKLKIIEQQHLMVPPAVYLLETNVPYPLGETLLPMAKRMLMEHLYR
ncbi:MAG: hypothetical protein M3Q97_09450, partial [Bacteroidota bacterium]|nr:hypothetical protein [Bacteroidota bacterium]